MKKYSERFTFEEIEPAIIWLNRSLRFYLPARELSLRDYQNNNSAILFLGFQAVESALKSSLILWDKSFDPLEHGHNTKKMFKIYRNKVPKDLRFLEELHEYFTNIDRFQALPRYPKEKIFFLPIDPGYLKLLDHTYCNLARSLPRTFWATELEHTLSGKNQSRLKTLRRKNSMMRLLRGTLEIKIGNNPKPKRITNRSEQCR
ncbi:hypothetical protein ACWPKS_08780 [Coraliomargarita sp. W4R72]